MRMWLFKNLMENLTSFMIRKNIYKVIFAVDFTEVNKVLGVYL